MSAHRVRIYHEAADFTAPRFTGILECVEARDRRPVRCEACSRLYAASFEACPFCKTPGLVPQKRPPGPVRCERCKRLRAPTMASCPFCDPNTEAALVPTVAAAPAPEDKLVTHDEEPAAIGLRASHVGYAAIALGLGAALGIHVFINYTPFGENPLASVSKTAGLIAAAVVIVLVFVFHARGLLAFARRERQIAGLPGLFLIVGIVTGAAFALTTYGVLMVANRWTAGEPATATCVVTGMYIERRSRLERSDLTCEYQGVRAYLRRTGTDVPPGARAGARYSLTVFRGGLGAMLMNPAVLTPAASDETGVTPASGE